MSSVPMNKEQAVEMARQSWDTTKENVAMLKDAGLFKLEYVMAFSKEMALPFDKENFSVSAIQSLLLAKMGDAQLEKGFTIMNAVAFILEVCGDLFALLFDRSLVLVCFEIVYAYLVAYVLYWLVVCAPPGPDYKLVALGLFVIYAIINTIQVVTTLGLIVPPIFYFAKTIASLCCAFYAFKIEKLTTGAEILKDDDGGELGVAE